MVGVCCVCSSKSAHRVGVSHWTDVCMYHYNNNNNWIIGASLGVNCGEEKWDHSIEMCQSSMQIPSRGSYSGSDTLFKSTMIFVLFHKFCVVWDQKQKWGKWYPFPLISSFLRPRENMHLTLSPPVCPLQCKECGRGFSVRYNLLMHIQTIHSQPQKYKCPMKSCKEAFHSQSRLNGHLRRIHKKDWKSLWVWNRV